MPTSAPAYSNTVGPIGPATSAVAYSNTVGPITAADTTPPTVALTAPAAGPVSGLVTVSASAADATGINNVRFFAGAMLIGTDTTSSYSIPWDTTKLQNGVYALTAVATDNAGNQNTSSPVSVTVANLVAPQPAQSGMPAITVEVAFTTNPDSTPAWQDISTYVRSGEIRRGRQREFDRIEAGVCTLMLNNRGRHFDPTYTDGLFYPNVLPMRQLRVRATHQGVVYDLFTGYVERWPQQWPDQGTDSQVPVTAVDGFGALSKAGIGTGAEWPQEDSGARVNRTLDAAEWPVLDRVISTGQSLIAAVKFAVDSDVMALAHIQDVASSELGLAFVNGSGDFVFHDRHRRRRAPYTTSQATIGDVPNAVTYHDLEGDYDVEQIYNDARVTAAGGRPAQVVDEASRFRFRRRTVARSTLLARRTEAEDQASYFVTTYKDPLLRLPRMDLTPRASLSLMTQALSREISDHITAVRTPMGLGNTINQHAFIESIEHRWQPDDWKTSWFLSPVPFTTIDWWVLGDSTYGVVSTTDRLVY